MSIKEDDYLAMVARLNRPKTKPKTEQKGSKLELQFLRYWPVVSSLEPVREFKFHPARKWKFDFAFPQRMVAIEIEGGTFMTRAARRVSKSGIVETVVVGGRHNTGAGYKADCEKYNAATMLGWRVLRLTEIKMHELREIAEWMGGLKT